MEVGKKRSGWDWKGAEGRGADCRGWMGSVFRPVRGTARAVACSVKFSRRGVVYGPVLFGKPRVFLRRFYVVTVL